MRKEKKDKTQPPTVTGLSIDNVVFGLKQGKLKILLVKHAGGYSEGQWALPGGYVQEDEDIDEASGRYLKSLTGVENLYLEQLRAFGAVNRVPHKRVLSVAYFALISLDEYTIKCGINASEVSWFDLGPDANPPIPELIFDHDEILSVGMTHLKHKVRHEPIGFNLLPPKFTLLQLQELYEAILGVKLDKPNFRRKMIKMKLLIPLGEKQQNVAHRAAELYRFDLKVYEKLKSQGFTFEV